MEETRGNKYEKQYSHIMDLLQFGKSVKNIAVMIYLLQYFLYVEVHPVWNYK